MIDTPTRPYLERSFAAGSLLMTDGSVAQAPLAADARMPRRRRSNIAANRRAVLQAVVTGANRAA